MADPKEETKATDQLSNEELESVQGGQGIDPITKMPNYQGPKLGAPKGSIAQGEINVTGGLGDDDNMPDSGGGIIA
jgi:hypothetical protein